MTSSLLEIGFEATGHKLQPPLISVGKSLSHTTSAIERILAHPSVVRKTEIYVIVGTGLMKWASALQVKIIMIIKPTSEDALQTSYLNSNEGFKTAIFNVIEQMLGDVVRPIWKVFESIGDSDPGSRPN